MSLLNFSFLAFSTNFCSNKIDLFGNTGFLKPQNVENFADFMTAYNKPCEL